MNPFERIQGAFGALGSPQLTPQQNQQQMMGLGQHIASPAQQQAQAAPQTGMFAKFNNHLQDNKSAMMAMASGMMGGPGQPGSIGQGFQNYAAAGQLDERRREKEQNRNATHDWLKKQGYGDEDIAFFQANPQVMAEALKPKTADATTGMKEYQLAQQQGFGGTFIDFTRAKQAENVPTGYETVTGGNGRMEMRPIKGSPAWEKQQDMERRVAGQAESNLTQADNMLFAIKNIRDAADKSMTGVAGFMGNAASHVPGTEAANVKVSLETIGGNLAFDRLQDMRSNSPTGGSLGQITERELDLLKAAQLAINQAQSEPEFFEALDRLEYQYLSVIHGEQQASQMMAGRKGGGDMSADDLIDYYGAD